MSSGQIDNEQLRAQATDGLNIRDLKEVRGNEFQEVQTAYRQVQQIVAETFPGNSTQPAPLIIVPNSAYNRFMGPMIDSFSAAKKEEAKQLEEIGLPYSHAVYVPDAGAIIMPEFTAQKFASNNEYITLSGIAILLEEFLHHISRRSDETGTEIESVGTDGSVKGTRITNIPGTKPGGVYKGTDVIVPPHIEYHVGEMEDVDKPADAGGNETGNTAKIVENITELLVNNLLRRNFKSLFRDQILHTQIGKDVKKFSPSNDSTYNLARALITGDYNPIDTLISGTFYEVDGDEVYGEINLLEWIRNINPLEVVLYKPDGNAFIYDSIRYDIPASSASEIQRVRRDSKGTPKPRSTRRLPRGKRS